MRSWFLGLLILTSTLTAPAWAAPIDVVLDIDWTTFYTIKPEDKNQMDPKAIQIAGKTYRPTEHLGEVLEKLLALPDIRISFFSGGETTRNEALLKAFKLPSGRSAFDISYKVLSKHDLTVVSEDQSLGFADRYKKNLEGILPGATMERTILIDDQIKFAVAPWKAVDSLGHLEFQSKFDPEKVGQFEHPATVEQWQTEKDKALMWLALIEEALNTSRKLHTPFSTAVTEIWAQKSHRPLCKNVFNVN
ncbi:hypothetical protein AAAA73_17155 [Bdellovibrio sp. GT3]